jgi:hypothetical protein
VKSYARFVYQGSDVRMNQYEAWDWMMSNRIYLDVVILYLIFLIKYTKCRTSLSEILATAPKQSSTRVNDWIIILKISLPEASNTDMISKDIIWLDVVISRKELS